jgi:DeoR/GlpR family transcriptional regulator of sugar metabolism
MAWSKTHQKRRLNIAWIIEMVKKYGHATTKDIVEMFVLHRTTAEKYIRVAVERGNLIRHGRCGIFRDQRALIDFDRERFTHRGTSQ